MSKLKYKKGDKVVILPFDLMKQKFGLTDTHIPTSSPFTAEMELSLLRTDRVIEIVADRTSTYNFKFPDGNYFTGCDEMILGHAFAWGEEIEVSQDGKIWDKRRFLSYTPGIILPINVASIAMNEASQLYKHARSIRKHEIEITVKRDSKELTVAELAKLTVEDIRDGLSHG